MGLSNTSNLCMCVFVCVFVIVFVISECQLIVGVMSFQKILNFLLRTDGNGTVILGPGGPKKL